MMKRAAFILLVLVPLSFAAPWQDLALVALMASLSALGIIYAIGYAFDIGPLRLLAREELVQLVGTGLLIAGFASFQLFLEGLSTDLGGGIPVVDLAKQNLGDINDALSGSNSLLVGLATHLGAEASKSAFCSFSAVSFSVAACGGFSAVAGPFPLAFQAIGAAAGEIATLDTMLDFGTGGGGGGLIFTLFFPLGLFLRTFKLTRGAGGLLVGIAVTFYLILPYSIVFVHATIEDTRANLQTVYGSFGDLSTGVSTESCDEYDFDDGNEQKAIKQLRNIIGQPAQSGAPPAQATYIQSVIYQVLISSTILLAVVLSIMVASIRALGSIGGAEIDVSPLARLL